MKDKAVFVGEVRLAQREVEVLLLVAEGLTNKEIAREVIVSEKQVGHMLSRGHDPRALYRRIGVSNRAEAAVWITRHSPELADYSENKPEALESNLSQGLEMVASSPYLQDQFALNLWMY